MHEIRLGWFSFLQNDNLTSQAEPKILYAKRGGELLKQVKSRFELVSGGSTVRDY